MANRLHRMGMGQGRGLWPVLILSLLAVIVPTVCLLWFMTEAVRNERMAVRQKLYDLYRSQLVDIRTVLQDFWEKKASCLSQVDENLGTGDLFAEFVQAGVADSVIIYDKAGQLAYPSVIEMSPGVENIEFSQWTRAERMEHEQADPASAAPAYAEIAQRCDNTNLAARALQAHVRSLVKAGEKQKAIEIVTGELADAKYRSATDTHGRLILPNIQLFALQLMKRPAEQGYSRILNLLVKRVRDYSDLSMSSAQRRFLMEELQSVEDELEFPTLTAETLAAKYLEARPPRPEGLKLSPALMNELWQLSSSDQTVIALFRHSRVIADMQSLIRSHASLPGVTIKVVPKIAEKEPEPFLSLPTEGYLPVWEIRLYLDEPSPFAAAADRQIAAYLWTALLVIGIISILATLMARYILRQIQLTRLKNDFVATVSHELKTPLASMRVLVDTLIEGNYRDEQQPREYLELIAKENERLSRLIDNFLTFSRMERNKRTFQFVDVEPEHIVRVTVESVRERFEAGSCTLKIEIAPNLPTIIADRDAMVTVLLNLLDNAYKYSENDICIDVRAYLTGEDICFEVEDNGIGLSRRDTRKVLDRFYQVDSTLSRQGGGCGLGLSIVKFIVEAHGGSVEVKSQLGKGSTFTVKLSVAGRPHSVCDNPG